ncbi:MAG: hypothetical protein KDA28_09150, partial [Phycisphaerales bacterium]|nr:hypothetical protein [Phycisphaerales bacterium]
MGYTLHYRATGDTPIGASALAALHAHAAEVSASLSRTAEAFAWRVVEGATEASGWTKPGLDLPDLERDV